MLTERETAGLSRDGVDTGFQKRCGVLTVFTGLGFELRLSVLILYDDRCIGDYRSRLLSVISPR